MFKKGLFSKKRKEKVVKDLKPEIRRRSSSKGEIVIPDTITRGGSLNASMRTCAVCMNPTTKMYRNSQFKGVQYFLCEKCIEKKKKQEDIKDNSLIEGDDSAETDNSD